MPVSMATQAYLDKVFSSPKIYLPNEKVLHWIHDHPTTVKVIRVAALIVGLGLLATLPFSFPAFGLGAALLALTGTLFTLAAAVSLFALDALAPPHHDMKKHLYPPGQCDGGKLEYEGDLPILTLDAADPFTAGKAHGYLAGIGIHELSKSFSFALHTILRRPRPERISHIIEPLKQQIPPQYLREMEGVVEGYNKWCDEHRRYRPRKMTLDEMILFHHMPDSVHFSTGGYHRKIRPLLGCAAIAGIDAQKGPILARNLDWRSLNKAGKYALVIHRKQQQNGAYSIVEVSEPGFVGTLTGMNERGLSLGMNVCLGETKEVQGMPAVIFNRFCLETCGDLPAVRAFVETHTPLGPYHLTVADPQDVQSFHFHQGGERFNVQRLNGDLPIIVLNWRHEKEPYSMGEIHHSRARQQMLDTYFTQANREIPAAEVDREKLIAASLRLPKINNYETIHTILMEPTTRTFKASFDDSFSAHTPLHTIPTHRLFN